MAASGSKRRGKTKAARGLVGPLKAEAAESLARAAGDLALTLSDAGEVVRAWCGVGDLSLGDLAGWAGRPWVDLVTIDSRPKIEELLAGDPAAAGAGRWREINYKAASGGASVPMLSTVLRLGEGGALLALGRDLRSSARMQQRLLSSEQRLEAERRASRRYETRNRLFFENASDPVFFLDASGFVILELNAAAAALGAARDAEEKGEPLDGRAILEMPWAEGGGARGLADLLEAARGRAAPVDSAIRLGPAGEMYAARAAPFREEGRVLIQLQLSPRPEATAAPGRPAPLKGSGAAAATVDRLMDRAPDGFVVTDPSGAIQLANAAFLDMTGALSLDRLRGAALAGWLGRGETDFDLMRRTLAAHGSLRAFATTIRADFGREEAVDVSAMALDGGAGLLGFLARSSGSSSGASASGGPARSVEELAELVGRVPLKDLVRETTDVLEKLCIEAALELTRGNRASAADMLGLSRQSLYVKLRRYGLGDPDSDAAE